MNKALPVVRTPRRLPFLPTAQRLSGTNALHLINSYFPGIKMINGLDDLQLSFFDQIF
jgi:hypothetical protein